MSEMFSENTSFLREKIIFWAPRGKLRSSRSQQVHHNRAKPLERHLKEDRTQRKHCNEYLICFEVQRKHVFFENKSFWAIWVKFWGIGKQQVQQRAKPFGKHFK